MNKQEREAFIAGYLERMYAVAAIMKGYDRSRVSFRLNAVFDETISKLVEDSRHSEISMAAFDILKDAPFAQIQNLRVLTNSIALYLLNEIHSKDNIINQALYENISEVRFSTLIKRIKSVRILKRIIQENKIRILDNPEFFRRRLDEFLSSGLEALQVNTKVFHAEFVLDSHPARPLELSDIEKEAIILYLNDFSEVVRLIHEYLIIPVVIPELVIPVKTNNHAVDRRKKKESPVLKEILKGFDGGEKGLVTLSVMLRNGNFRNDPVTVNQLVASQTMYRRGAIRAELRNLVLVRLVMVDKSRKPYRYYLSSLFKYISGDDSRAILQVLAEIKNYRTAFHLYPLTRAEIEASRESVEQIIGKYPLLATAFDGGDKDGNQIPVMPEDMFDSLAHIKMPDYLKGVLSAGPYLSFDHVPYSYFLSLELLIEAVIKELQTGESAIAPGNFKTIIHQFLLREDVAMMVMKIDLYKTGKEAESIKARLAKEIAAGIRETESIFSSHAKSLGMSQADVSWLVVSLLIIGFDRTKAIAAGNNPGQVRGALKKELRDFYAQEINRFFETRMKNPGFAGIIDSLFVSDLEKSGKTRKFTDFDRFMQKEFVKHGISQFHARNIMGVLMGHPEYSSWSTTILNSSKGSFEYSAAVKNIYGILIFIILYSDLAKANAFVGGNSVGSDMTTAMQVQARGRIENHLDLIAKGMEYFAGMFGYLQVPALPAARIEETAKQEEIALSPYQPLYQLILDEVVGAIREQRIREWKPRVIGAVVNMYLENNTEEIRNVLGITEEQFVSELENIRHFVIVTLRKDEAVLNAFEDVKGLAGEEIPVEASVIQSVDKIEDQLRAAVNPMIRLYVDSPSAVKTEKGFIYRATASVPESGEPVYKAVEIKEENKIASVLSALPAYGITREAAVRMRAAGVDIAKVLEILQRINLNLELYPSIHQFIVTAENPEISAFRSYGQQVMGNLDTVEKLISNRIAGLNVINEILARRFAWERIASRYLPGWIDSQLSAENKVLVYFKPGSVFDFKQWIDAYKRRPRIAGNLFMREENFQLGYKNYQEKSEEAGEPACLSYEDYKKVMKAILKAGVENEKEIAINEEITIKQDSIVVFGFDSYNKKEKRNLFSYVFFDSEHMFAVVFNHEGKPYLLYYRPFKFLFATRSMAPFYTGEAYESSGKGLLGTSAAIHSAAVQLPGWEDFIRELLNGLKDKSGLSARAFVGEAAEQYLKKDETAVYLDEENRQGRTISRLDVIKALKSLPEINAIFAHKDNAYEDTEEPEVNLVGERDRAVIRNPEDVRAAIQAL
ncbi:MAG: hypothetical protein PHE58_06405, partial [Candidatus Omnitrophica bacterium]|nr:hypothetical protein [Candidatus Omnitrophota bacterium]